MSGNPINNNNAGNLNNNNNNNNNNNAIDLNDEEALNPPELDLEVQPFDLAFHPQQDFVAVALITGHIKL